MLNHTVIVEQSRTVKPKISAIQRAHTSPVQYICYKTFSNSVIMQNSTGLIFLVLAAMIALAWAAAIGIEPEELDTAEQRHHGYGYGHHRGHHGGGYGGYGGYRGNYGGYGGYDRPYGGYGGFY